MRGIDSGSLLLITSGHTSGSLRTLERFRTSDFTLFVAINIFQRHEHFGPFVSFQTAAARPYVLTSEDRLAFLNGKTYEIHYYWIDNTCHLTGNFDYTNELNTERRSVPGFAIVGWGRGHSGLD